MTSIEVQCLYAHQVTAAWSPELVLWHSWFDLIPPPPHYISLTKMSNWIWRSLILRLHCGNRGGGPGQPQINGTSSGRWKIWLGEKKILRRKRNKMGHHVPFVSTALKTRGRMLRKLGHSATSSLFSSALCLCELFFHPKEKRKKKIFKIKPQVCGHWAHSCKAKVILFPVGSHF